MHRTPTANHKMLTATSLAILVLASLALTSCSHPEPGVRIAEPKSTMTVAFYNVENLFDAKDDPANPGDDEFTPNGALKWTEVRLERKLDAVARVIRSMDQYGGADIVGLSEVENREVLDRLVDEFLPQGQYAVVHAPSEDERGIDVALIYRPSAMRAVAHRQHRVNLGEDRTRQILEVTFEREGRTFTVLVNHWPSRSGGQSGSEPKRIEAARTAASVIDSLYARDRNADIIMLGDLNDEPSDASVSDVLDARAMTAEEFDGRMINLAAPVQSADTIGSYFFRGDWQAIDQILLSRGALDDRGLVLLDESETVHTPDFIRDDRADPKERPAYRTYKGRQYIGGTSDHFPVFARVGWR